MNSFRNYVHSLKNDIPASIVVFLVALPLCLGIALGSQAPSLFSGLIAGIVGGVVIGVASGSQLSVSGPAAGLTTIVAAAIMKLPTYEAFLLAVVICGVFQIVLGYLKAGIIGNYIPVSVIKGMLAAIGLILILKQFPHLVGYDKDYEGDEAFFQVDDNNTFSEIFKALNYLTPLAVLIGVVSLLIQIIWDKIAMKQGGIFKIIPAPLLVVFVGAGINYYFEKQGSSFAIDPEHMVNIPIAKSAAEFFSFFTFPDFNMWKNFDVWITAGTLAVVASLESLLSLEAIDKLDPYKRISPTNRELKAQGLGNLVSGLIGGLPVTSVIVRSSANVSSGAKTKVSAIVHGMLLLLSVAFIPNILNLIPKSALAGILIYTGYKLAKPTLFVTYFKKGWNQFLPFVLTIAAILLTDLLKGVVFGLAVGFFFVLRSNFKTAILFVKDENNYLIRLRKDVSFLNKPIIKEYLSNLPDNSKLLIDASKAEFIDKDIVEVFEDFMIEAPTKDISVALKPNSQLQDSFGLPLLEVETGGYAKLDKKTWNQQVNN